MGQKRKLQVVEQPQGQWSFFVLLRLIMWPTVLLLLHSESSPIVTLFLLFLAAVETVSGGGRKQFPADSDGFCAIVG